MAVLQAKSRAPQREYQLHIQGSEAGNNIPAMLLQLIASRNGPISEPTSAWDNLETYGVQGTVFFLRFVSAQHHDLLWFLLEETPLFMSSQRSTASNNSSILSSWPTLDFAWSCAESISPSALVAFDAWRGSFQVVEVKNCYWSLYSESGMLPDLNLNSPTKNVNPPKITRVQGKDNENRLFFCITLPFHTQVIPFFVCWTRLQTRSLWHEDVQVILAAQLQGVDPSG